VSGLTSPAFLDTTVTNGITYYYRVSAVNAGGEGALSNEASATPLVPNPPNVVATSINGGANQRSMVTNLAVTFNTLVNFAPGAFVLSDLAGNTVPNVTLSINSVPVLGQTVANITFTGSAVIGGSLADGRYRLRVVAANVTNQAAPFSPMASDVTFEFHRFYGDINGDAHVDIVDFGQFSATFNLMAGQTGFIAAFDFNNDGRIDIADFGQFSLRIFTPFP
jgi:hypothetical protein